MSNYIILHGSFGSKDGNWFPWLKKELENKNIKVDVPQMPVGVGSQNFENWSAELNKLEINSDTTIIAHSIAPIFVCKYLITNKIKVKKLIFVCGFNNYLGIDSDFDAVNKPMFIDNYIDAKKYCDNIVCFYSDNDPYVKFEVEKEFADEISSKQYIIKNGGHINTESGYTKFEEILEEIYCDDFNILITSGGFNDINNYVSDSNKELFERISKGKKVLILANAAPEGTGNYVARENVKENFLNVGAIVADIIDIDNSNIEDILKYDIVYGLGGNLTHLIELNKATNLKEVLIKFLKKGIYIGESAGSMILCEDLKYAYTIKKGTKPKYDVELDTYKGLNFVKYKIYPHYNKVNEEMEEKIKLYEDKYDEKITRLNDGEIIKIRYIRN